MNISEMVYSAAIADNGTWEWAGDDHNPAVLKYYADAGHPEIKNDEVPWCAAYVGAKLASVGLIPTGSLLARSYERWGEEVPLAQARQGDVVILSRGAAWQGHVAFFHAVTGGRIQLLGGNQGNQVNIKGYAVDRIVSIRRAKEPYTSVASSKQVKISSGQMTAGASSVASGIFMLDGQAQIIAIVGGLLLVAFGMWFFRERLQKYAAGIR